MYDVIFYVIIYIEIKIEMSTLLCNTRVFLEMASGKSAHSR